ncbi:MAG: CPBP family intramembrane metalloprotease [Ardenticatenaceae bacterium]|nr:CPBP family intramembrane metalloprotease [Anaerolineales bacterium]MCB8922771.1 CPBP family intramembrane metalloprotease [Ardenticatenaceae bacterium]
MSEGIQTAVSKPSSKVQTIIAAGGLLAGGIAIFVFGNPYYRVFPTNRNQTYAVGLTVFSLVLALVFRRIPSLARYGTAVYALFVAAAVTVSLQTGMIRLHHSAMLPMQNLAMDKLSQFLMIVPILMSLICLGGGDAGSIFIKLGDWKRGLRFGLLWFVLFGAAGLAIQWGAMDLEALVTAVPYLLLFVFANATMEELWFRGIFLRSFEALIGRWGAVVVTAVLFGASHINATYDFPGGSIIFGVVVFILGAVGAHAMLKDDSVIGPILFHAGYDLMIIVPVINSL